MMLQIPSTLVRLVIAEALTSLHDTIKQDSHVLTRQGGAYRSS
jgi:hypothetical protein